jgi:hypothetical protein
MSTQGRKCYTKIEQKLRDALLERGDHFDPIEDRAWYFVVNFEDVRADVPYGRLMRYEKNDWPFEPSAYVDIPGKIVGDVRIEQGRAYFDGGGFIQFPVTQHAVDVILPPKIPVPLADPKPLLMICHGQIASSSADTGFGNPALYYECGTSSFGMFVPDGTARVRINAENVGNTVAEARTAFVGSDSAIWLAYIDSDFAQEANGPRYRLLNEVISPDDILNHVVRQEFFLNHAFSVGLVDGATFTIGGATVPESKPFRGWIEEAIFDPSGGTGNGRGQKTSKLRPKAK